MDIAILTDFFKWCTIINGALLAFWSLMQMLAPDLLYRTQSRWFPIPRDTFDVLYYAFLGLYKILFLLFNAVPLAALMLLQN